MIPEYVRPEYVVYVSGNVVGIQVNFRYIDVRHALYYVEKISTDVILYMCQVSRPVITVISLRWDVYHYSPVGVQLMERCNRQRLEF